MRMTRLAVATTVAGLITLFSASTAHAVDYAEPEIGTSGGSAADGVVAPGEEFTLTGDFGGVECDPWVAEFLDDSETGSGTTYSVSFTAPTEPGDYDIVFTCTYDEPAELSASGVEAFTPFNVTEEIGRVTITVEGADAGDSGSGSGDDSDALPDTGGSNLLLIAGGAALVLAGSGLIVARRRNS